jgi:hypothetical protein
MKKSIFVLAASLLGLVFFNSCRETKEKETIVIEKETEEKGALEKAGEKVDKEVNEEIDKAIDDIGDDN